MQHTYWSIDIPTSYCGYMHSYVPNSTNSNAHLGFSYLGHIKVKSRSDLDCYPGHAGQQLWPGFNADLYAIFFRFLVKIITQMWSNTWLIIWASKAYMAYYILAILENVVYCKIQVVFHLNARILKAWYINYCLSFLHPHDFFAPHNFLHPHEQTISLKQPICKK